MCCRRGISASREGSLCGRGRTLLMRKGRRGNGSIWVKRRCWRRGKSGGLIGVWVHGACGGSSQLIVHQPCHDISKYILQSPSTYIITTTHLQLRPAREGHLLSPHTNIGLAV